jgi:hypothetical protein
LHLLQKRANKVACNASKITESAVLASGLLTNMQTDTEWQIDNARANRKRFEKYSKNHPREYDSLFANLEKVMRLLRTGHKIGSFQIGFFRSESDGLFRIGQTGVPGAKESRLYVYPEQEKHLMHVLNIGDKDSQSADINAAKDLIRQIRKESEKLESR